MHCACLAITDFTGSFDTDPSHHAHTIIHAKIQIPFGKEKYRATTSASSALVLCITILEDADPERPWLSVQLPRVQTSDRSPAGAS